MDTLDTGFHDRWLAEQMKDPEFSREYELACAEIEQVDNIMRQLDQLRVQAGLNKTALARRIGKNPVVIRRMFTAEANPELKTIAALAAALDAEITVVPHKPAGETTRQEAPKALVGGAA